MFRCVQGARSAPCDFRKMERVFIYGFYALTQEASHADPRFGTMRRMIVFAMMLVLYAAAQRSGIAQTQVEVRACTERGNAYDCDRHSFEGVLGLAKTISIQIPRLDPTSFKELQQLASSLGKTVQPESADLTLILSGPDPNGIYFGPSDRKLATISIYYKASSSNPGKLIWTESYFGQPDTPQRTAAHAVIEQFRKDVKHP